jgi:signal transduction histidine kinase
LFDAQPAQHAVLFSVGGSGLGTLTKLEFAMNNQSATICRANRAAGKIVGRSALAAFGDTQADTVRESLGKDSCQIADLRRSSLRVRGQDLNAENGQSNEFMTVFSHELRNSLSAIRFAVDILSMETSSGPAALKARIVIERQVAQMTRMAEDLLDVSRVRRGQLTVRHERVDLCAVAGRAAQTVEFIMRERNHCLSISLPSAPVWLQADPVRLEQVLVNLLFNAAKYTQPGGRIHLSAERQESDVVIGIRDSGIGIESHVLPHVFDLFVQAQPSSRRGGGLGIGLALVRNLVEQHGGRVTAASAGLGHGSEFTVRLPLPIE